MIQLKENVKTVNDFRKCNKRKSAQNSKKVLCIRDEDLGSLNRQRTAVI